MAKLIGNVLELRYENQNLVPCRQKQCSSMP